MTAPTPIKARSDEADLQPDGMVSRGDDHGAHSVSERCLQAVAWAYLVLLPLDIRLHGPLFLHDLLAPILALLILDRRTWTRLRRLPFCALPAFLAVGAFATAAHARAPVDFYEPAIFAYMAVLFLAFVRFSPRPAHLALYAALVLTAMLCHSLGEILVGMRRSYAIYEGSSLAFIARRYFFTFEHPNLAGSFYILPVSCLLMAYCLSGLKLKRNGVISAAILSLVACIPLMLTVSRHMMISIFSICVFFMDEMRSSYNRYMRRIIKPFMLSIFTLFYLTILVPFFPLKAQFPYINVSTVGMYMTHQSIYFRMAMSSFARFATGLGHTGLHETYPLFADRSAIHAVLSQYRQESLTDTFATYMDAHNEYLNLAVLFGVPAMLLCVAFWVGIGWSAWRRLKLESVPATLDEGRLAGPDSSLPDGSRVSAASCRLGRIAERLFEHRVPGTHVNLAASLTIVLVIGVLLAALWDDILSKRWIWIALALSVGCLERCSSSSAQGGGATE
ncbi:MAG: hypothetical protein HN742_32070 [Lentisphaerae bacterium]|nr:hypothetical protein [Lentisphaerota bacterium]MBT4815921.1 hypothetical protein [Lentisphaerota bacterium]MBT5611605.1 hypothetical protein [Lentisphaerota bacterium]MBT7061704.1 hypothetical protein [Lentisphaerota bacterium]MBT7846550.1 hypothetical protein [Lentisphaerota bacterium]